MKTERKSISGLYYNYGKRSDESIINFLNNVKIIKKINNKYYEVNDYDFVNKPRKHSLTFDVEFEKEFENNYTPYKKITYLVKSTSRFFIKPDIGEILDQISFNDWYMEKIKAIEFINSEYIPLKDTDDEHYTMKVILYI